MPTRLFNMPARDPLGYPQNNIDYMPQRLPRNYPRGVCQCLACVTHFCEQHGVQHAAYNPDGYQQSPSSMQQRWTSTMDAYFGAPFPAGFQHPRRPTRWSNYEQEKPLLSVFDQLINHPLRFMLKRSGRVWSAEVECNEIDYTRAAELLGSRGGRYSTRPDRPQIISTPDGTVDAEIKISCMRDGSPEHAQMARNAYSLLAQHGAACAVNAGHHVHVDGTRLADLGTQETEQVMRAVWRTASVCRAALVPLAGSGYSKQRGSSTSFNEGTMLSSRQAIHGARLYGAARNRAIENATIEYRLPNATLSPIRAQSFIAVPLGLLDFAERAVLDEDDRAARFLAQINDRHDHANRFDELTATQFLIDAVRFSKDSRKAMAIAAFTSPSVSSKARSLWEQKAEGLHTKLEKLVSAEEQRIAQNAERIKKKKVTSTTPERVRDSSGRFAPSANPNAAIWAQLAKDFPATAQPQQIILDPTPYDDDPDYEPDYEDDYSDE